MGLIRRCARSFDHRSSEPLSQNKRKHPVFGRLLCYYRLQNRVVPVAGVRNEYRPDKDGARLRHRSCGIFKGGVPRGVGCLRLPSTP